MIYPAITLYQPWATWIIRGWKTIETRTHSRFSSLEGKTVLIHAGMKTDKEAFDSPYLNRLQMADKEPMVNGFILGAAYVYDVRLLTSFEAQRALIECDTKRYGLFLDKIIKFEHPIPAKGQMGIWYYDLDKQEAVKKPVEEKPARAKRDFGDGYRKPMPDEHGELWCTCVNPNLTSAFGRGQAWCMKCKTPYYH